MIRRAGGVPRLVRLAPPHWRLDPRGAGERVHRPHPAGGAEQSAEPGRRSPSPRKISPCWPSSACAIDPIAVCDEVWEQVVFAAASPPPADRLSGHARALREDRLGGQDVRPDRLEDRLPVRRPGPHRRRWPRRTSSSPSPRRRTCRPRSPGGWTTATTGSQAMPAHLARSRDRLADGLRREGFAVLRQPGHLFPRTSTCPPRASQRTTPTSACARSARHGVAAIPLSAFYEADAGDQRSSACASPRPTRPWTRACGAWRGRARRWPERPGA